MGEAWVTIDDDCALLHGMVCSEPYVRWLLHTEIVKRLCAHSCRMLLTNSHDAPLLSPGQQYFQRLLGYSVARLRPTIARAEESRAGAHVGLSALVAVVAIVGVQTLASPFHLAGHRALVWLTALVAIRVATNRAGSATLVGGIAGLSIVLLGAASALAVPLAYFLCGVTLDVELALVPRLARSALAMSLAGASVIFVTLVAPSFPTLGHHPAGRLVDHPAHARRDRLRCALRRARVSTRPRARAPDTGDDAQRLSAFADRPSPRLAAAGHRSLTHIRLWTFTSPVKPEMGCSSRLAPG